MTTPDVTQHLSDTREGGSRLSARADQTPSNSKHKALIEEAKRYLAIDGPDTVHLGRGELLYLIFRLADALEASPTPGGEYE